MSCFSVRRTKRKKDGTGKKPPKQAATPDTSVLANTYGGAGDFAAAPLQRNLSRVSNNTDVFVDAHESLSGSFAEPGSPLKSDSTHHDSNAKLIHVMPPAASSGGVRPSLGGPDVAEEDLLQGVRPSSGDDMAWTSTSMTRLVRTTAAGLVPGQSLPMELGPKTSAAEGPVEIWSTADGWLNDLLAMMWPFLRAAAHQEVLNIVDPVLESMPPFVANVLLLGKVVAVPIQGIQAAVRLVDMMGPNPPKIHVSRVYLSPDGHACLDWQLKWRMAASASMILMPQGLSAKDKKAAKQGTTLKSKAHRWLVAGVDQARDALDQTKQALEQTKLGGAINPMLNKLDDRIESVMAPLRQPPAAPSNTISEFQASSDTNAPSDDEDTQSVMEAIRGNAGPAGAARAGRPLFEDEEARKATMLATWSRQQMEAAISRGISIGEWAAIGPEQEEVCMQGSLMDTHQRQADLPSPAGSILAACTLDSSMTLQGNMHISLQSVADALAAALEQEPIQPGKVKLPPGVPAIETMDRFRSKGWMNQLLECLWPQLRPLAGPFIAQIAPQIIAAVKPYWIADVRLGSIDIGSVPPLLRRVRIFEDGHDLTPDVQMDMDLEWFSADMSAEVVVQLVSNKMRYLPQAMAKAISSFMVFRGGVSDFWVRARLRFMFRPMLERLPVLGAVQVALVELPSLDMQLKAYGTEMGWMLGPIKGFLVNTIRDVVLGQYIFPDAMTIPVDQAVRPINPPEGLLELEVVEAAGVPRMDWGWANHADVFAEVWVSKNSKARTKVITSAAPTWNEKFSFPVHMMQHQQLKIVIWDADMLGNDEIGRVMVDLSGIESGTHDLWIEVPRTTRSNVAEWSVGNLVDETSSAFRVHLRGRWFRFSQEEIGVICAAQMYGPLRVLSTPSGRDLDENVACYLLQGRLKVILQSVKGLNIKLGKRVHAEVKCLDKVETAISRYGLPGLTSSKSPTMPGPAHGAPGTGDDDAVASFSQYCQFNMDLTEVSLGEQMTITLRQTNGLLLGQLKFAIRELVDHNVAGWHPVEKGKPNAEMLLFISWTGFFD